MSGSLTRDLKKMHGDFVKQWADKFNALLKTVNNVQAGVGSIAGGVAQNLAGVKANLDANGDALEQFDIFNQIWAKMLMRIVQRAEQTDYMRVQGILSMEHLSATDLDVIKDRSKDWFDATFMAMKEEVKEEREAYIKELRAKVAEQQAADTKEKEGAKKEAAVAEEALRGAEQNLSVSGGHGSDIPAGAEVFGG